MRLWLTLLLIISAICGRAFSQEEGRVIATGVCEIMQHPEHFDGKVLKIRAQIWTDHNQFWLNESAATSIRLNAFCGWLPAKFVHPTNLVGSKAFATFTGRLISDPGSSWRHVLFLIEGDADIYRQEVMNGLALVPQLYDPKVRAFVRPRMLPEMQFPVTAPMVCGYLRNGNVPIRFCTKG